MFLCVIYVHFSLLCFVVTAGSYLNRDTWFYDFKVVLEFNSVLEELV